MCFGICSFIKAFIKTCFYIAIDVVVFFTCSICDFADSIQWPVFKAVYGLLKAILKNFFEVKRITEVPHLSGEYGIQDFQRGNAYVEDLLQVINEYFGDKVFIIEDKVAGFQNTKIICIEGELICSTFQMNYRIMRSGNCLLREEGERSRVNASIKGCELYLEFDVHMKIANFTKKLHVIGNIPYIEVYVQLYFNNETLEDGELTDFIILDMCGTNLKFFGAGFLNSSLNFISKKIINMFKRRVQTVLQKKMRSQLAILVADLSFPVAGISEIREHSSPIEQQRARPKVAEHSSRTEQQQARSEAAERPSPTEQQEARPEAAEHSSSTEKHRVESNVGNSSPSTEQQIQATAENPHSSDRDSSPEIPTLVNLRKEKDSSQSSEGNDTAETDCSLEA